jgi:hypothetical protein
MSLPLVTMQPPTGTQVPTHIHLPDGSRVFPNASGQISVASNFVTTLIAAGWQVVISSGATHVP